MLPAILNAQKLPGTQLHCAALLSDLCLCYAGLYKSLDCETVKEYLDNIKAYPVQPKPEIFGLHENADITCDQNDTYEMFSTLLALQPRVSAGAGVSREEAIAQLCEDISSKVGPGMLL